MYVSGYHKAKYSPASSTSGGGTTYSDIGSTRDGWHLEVDLHQQNIQDDAYGDAIAGQINLGKDHMLTLDYVDYDKFQIALQAVGTEGLANDKVGLLNTNLFGPLVLTPAPGSTAETVLGVGKSYVFFKAGVEGRTSILFGSRLRSGPATFRCLPDPTNGNKVYDKITTPVG